MSPETRWRMLLRAYPRAEREARTEEMLTVLIATEERRGRRSVMPEATSLVAHGLAQRVRRPFAGRSERSATAVAGVALLLMLAVLGVHQLAATAARGLGLDGSPDAGQPWQLWVDPRWPIHVVWLTTGIALVLRRPRTALALAWVATALSAWCALAHVTTGFPLPWVGDLLGPTWVAPFGAGEVGWLVLTWLAAIALGGPARLARTLEALPARTWAQVLLVGSLASAVSFAAGPALVGLTGLDVSLRGSARGAATLALAASGVVLLSALRRTPHARSSMLLLAAALLIPVATRWGAPTSFPVAAPVAAALAAGYLAGTLHRASPEPAGEPTGS